MTAKQTFSHAFEQLHSAGKYCMACSKPMLGHTFWECEREQMRQFIFQGLMFATGNSKAAPVAPNVDHLPDFKYSEEPESFDFSNTCKVANEYMAKVLAEETIRILSNQLQFATGVTNTRFCQVGTKIGSTIHVRKPARFRP